MDKVRCGVIGCGAISQIVHLPAYRDMKTTELVAVADIDPKRAEEIGKKFGAKYWYSDYKQLLGRDDIDAVSICTPNFLHCEQAVAAAEAGKHIQLEKPMAVTIEECDRIIDACNKAHVKLMIGFNERFEPINQRVKKIIDSGTIGKVVQIRNLVSYGGPYHFWPAVSDWFYDPKKAGGGCLIDEGVHFIDMTRWFMGQEIASVYASAATLVKDIKAEDNVIVVLNFTSGALGEVDVSWTFNDGFMSFLEVLGTKGNLVVRPQGASITVSSQKTELPEDLKGPIEIPIRLSMEQRLALQIRKMEHFIECIQKDTEPLSSGYDGKASLEAILACYESIKTDRKMPVGAREEIRRQG